MHHPSILILGIGNVLWADEGFGVRAVEAMHRQYHLPANVTVMDGGTQGIYLIPHVQQADTLIIFDAIDFGLPPGELHVIRDHEVPKFMGAKKLSLHQTGFQEVLSMAEMLGQCPSHIVLIGVQPVELDDYGGSLRPAVKAQIAPAIDIALAELSDRGITAEARSAPLHEEQGLNAAGIKINTYETDRPSDAAACRRGDPRVLASKAFAFEPKSMLSQEGHYRVDLGQRRQD